MSELIIISNGDNMKLQIKTMIRIALSIALIAIGDQIKIPSPIAGYFTLQLPAVLITAILLGKKNGHLAVSIYLLGGLTGIPWFAAGGGIGYVLKPTFGFFTLFCGCSLHYCIRT
jgi:biotin transport system substrate-specific component